VFVYRLVARDTVEERILQLQAQKRRIAEAAIDGGAAVQLTRDDLLSLIDDS
jgi:SNF2 family DNA or RNA helicase